MKKAINIPQLRELGILIFGDENYRGTCPNENTASQTLVTQTRKRYPDTVFMHVKNEGKRTKQQMDLDQAMGFRTGVSDYLFIGNPTMALELKQANHKNSKITDAQIKFLVDVKNAGGLAVLALGGVSAVEAMEYWQSIQKKPHDKI